MKPDGLMGIFLINHGLAIPPESLKENSYGGKLEKTRSSN
jgi:hypothetical protein